MIAEVEYGKAVVGVNFGEIGICNSLFEMGKCPVAIMVCQLLPAPFPDVPIFPLLILP